jgi:hypothetical protein
LFGGVAGEATGADAASVDDGGDAVGADDEGPDAASSVPAGVVEEVVAMGAANRQLTTSTKTGHQPHRYTHGLLYLAVPYYHRSARLVIVKVASHIFSSCIKELVGSV